MNIMNRYINTGIDTRHIQPPTHSYKHTVVKSYVIRNVLPYKSEDKQTERHAWTDGRTDVRKEGRKDKD